MRRWPSLPSLFFMEKKKEKAEKCNVLYIVALFFFLLFFNRRRRRCGADRNVPIQNFLQPWWSYYNSATSANPDVLDEKIPYFLQL